MADAGVRKVMVGVDKSDASERAFQWILHNLLKKSDHVFILNSAPVSGFELPDADLPNGVWMPSLCVLDLGLGLASLLRVRFMLLVH
jgi:hypothetical protein